MTTNRDLGGLVNRLHAVDALDLLHQLPDQSIDLVLTDPPYSSGGLHVGTRRQAVGTKYAKRADQYAAFDHDHKDQRAWLAWSMMWLSQAYRACKPGGLLVSFIDWRQLPTLTDAVQCAGFIWRGVAVWDKTPGRCRPRAGGFSQQAEFIVWASRGPMRADCDAYLPGVFSERLTLPKRHLTEKPAGLAAEVMRLVPPGGVVLDPFAGSGTFLAAAQAAGHRWIGCELAPAYHEVAVKRLADTETA